MPSGKYKVFVDQKNLSIGLARTQAKRPAITQSRTTTRPAPFRRTEKSRIASRNRPDL